MKNKLPLKVGITGGIGAGKSIVSEVFKSLGIPVYHSDLRAKFLMETEVELIDRIKSEFGDESYSENNKLDNRFLSKLVFQNTLKLNSLNTIVHPFVLRDYEKWTELHKNTVYTIKEAALLFESGSYKDLDAVIFVYAPLKLRINRTLLRDMHRSTDDIMRIVNTQMSDSRKKKLSDYVLINDDTKLLLPQILNVHNQLCARSKPSN